MQNESPLISSTLTLACPEVHSLIHIQPSCPRQMILSQGKAFTNLYFTKRLPLCTTFVHRSYLKGKEEAVTILSPSLHYSIKNRPLMASCSSQMFLLSGVFPILPAMVLEILPKPNFLWNLYFRAADQRVLMSRDALEKQPRFWNIIQKKLSKPLNFTQFLFTKWWQCLPELLLLPKFI